ncbi:MAG: tetratricopeptide repeat protein [Pirellulales bacterium]|nr:tetratricopeptide repeat protein [Pirellulales bacterium]
MAAAVALVAIAAFWNVRDNEFLRYDDGTYLTDNAHVRQGLTWEGVRWALTTTYAANWHPLTWLAHMTNCSLWGSEPSASAAHHLTSAVLHAASAALLYMLLRLLGPPPWPAAAAALLFAVHPLRVESVAWAAELKDVLAVFFGLATLVAYRAYAARPTSWAAWLAMIALYALGILCKPSLVVLPVLLLLLDVWPLARLAAGRRMRDGLLLLQEKVPLFVLAALSASMTLHAQRAAGAVSALEHLPASVRVENALAALGRYLASTVWPTGLSFCYPHPVQSPAPAAVVVSTLLLLSITAFACWQANRRPYVIVAWLWFLLAALPTLGLVQAGVQSRADRYTYLPHVGLALLTAFALAEIAARSGLAVRRAWLAIAAIAVGLLFWRTTQQVAVWHDTLKLANHALEIDPRNAVALAVKGEALAHERRHQEAIDCFRRSIETANWLAESHALLAMSLAITGRPTEAMTAADAALALKPRLATAHYVRGNVLLERGDLAGAENALLAAVESDPQHAPSWCDLAWVLYKTGRPAEAERRCRQALSLDRHNAIAWHHLGSITASQGRMAEAIEAYQAAVTLEPNYADALLPLASLSIDSGQSAAAARFLETAMVARPGWPAAANELAWLYATNADPALQNPMRAVELAETACRATGRQQVEYLDTLAAAYARLGRWEDAIATLSEALARLRGSEVSPQLGAMEQRLAAYRRHEPWVDLPAAGAH